MKQLQSFSIVAPGFYGLNSQDSGITIDAGFSTVANNLVIDKYGRLGGRKGWVDQVTTSIYGSEPVRHLSEHVDRNDNVTVLSAGNLKIGAGTADPSSSDVSTITDITPSGYVINDNEWESANLFGLTLLVQENQEPLVYDNDASSGDLQTLTNYLSNELSITTAQNFTTNYPKGVIAAYGRFWVYTDDTVYWSTDIADANFPCFCGGTSGYLNIASVLPKNVDKLNGLAIHNDLLVIFGKNNIVLYSHPINPIGTSFGLYDVIAGVGCIARRSIQATGNDLLFLSDTGVRSLGRLVQEKSLPLRELTRNVQDELLYELDVEAANYAGSFDHICSVYSEAEGFYLLALPSQGFVYCLNMRNALQDGSAKVTKWVSFPLYSVLRKRNRDVLLGKNGTIGLYTGYLDDGVKYVASFLSSYNTLQSPTILKILKRLKATIVGGSGQDFTLKVVTDFGENEFQFPLTIEATSTIAEFGSAEFNVGEFSGAVNDIQTGTISATGSGSTIQVGFDADIYAQPLSVQKIDLLFKTGRNV